MKIKLTRAQFKAIYALLQAHVLAVVPRGIEQTMVHDTLYKVYEKFYYRDLDIKKKYTIPLTDAEACAMYFYFSRVDFEGLPYEQNLIQTINNQIHQQYA